VNYPYRKCKDVLYSIYKILIKKYNANKFLQGGASDTARLSVYALYMGMDEELHVAN
jgi:hypothetical protein